MTERMDDEFDALLNRELREVPLPTGLRSRLEAIALFDASTLNDDLRAVPVPGGLLNRLQAIPTEVVIRRWRRLPQPVRLALAASLLVFIGSAWIMAALLGTADLYGRSIAERDVLEPELLAEFARPGDFVVDDEPAVAVELPLINTALSALAQAPQPFETPWDGRLFPRRPQISYNSADRRPALNVPQRHSALLADLYAAPLVAGVRRANIHAPPRAQAPLPLGASVELGMSPLEIGFQARTGVFPPLSTAGRAATNVGVTIGTGSYDTLRDALRRDQIPTVDQLRTEEMLTALAPLWVGPPVAAKPKQPSDPPPSLPPFNLTILGGPSTFSGSDHRLIVVGLRARELPPVAHRSTQLTVVVDTSAAMQVAGRLASVQRELSKLARQFGADDRVSLVQFADSAQVLLDDLPAKDAKTWNAALASLQAGGNCEPVTGVATGLAVARAGRATPPAVRRVIVVTHASSIGDEATWQRLQPLVAVARKEGVTLDVLAVSPVEPLDSNWQRLADAGDGRLLRAVNPAQLQGLLAESFMRRPQIVLPEAQLSVSFPAGQVASYRLLGHEPSPPAAAIVGTQVDSHLYAGQTISVAFEIRPVVPNPPAGTPDAELATVTVEWLNRATGERVKSARKLMRSQLKPTFGESSPAWQTAALVASAAEIWRGSPFAERLTTAEVAQALRQIAAPQSNRPEFREWLGVVEQAEALRQRSTNPRGGRVK